MPPHTANLQTLNSASCAYATVRMQLFVSGTDCHITVARTLTGACSNLAQGRCISLATSAETMQDARLQLLSQRIMVAQVAATAVPTSAGSPGGNKPP